jgi:hypothetical protein
MKDRVQIVFEKGLWIVKKNEIVYSMHTKKEVAVKVAKVLAHNLHTDLFIHRKNSEILITRPL